MIFVRGLPPLRALARLRPTRLLVGAFFVSALSARTAAAQTGRLVGQVVDKLAGAPLAYSGVSIVDKSAERLTSDSGAFQFDLDAGTVRLRVRHVGFTPVDTQVVVRANDTTRIRIELARIPVMLAAMRVTDAPCLLPGAPAATGEALPQIFEQLQLNAEQFQLVNRQYPFTSVVERQFSRTAAQPKKPQANPAGLNFDTLEFVTKTDSIKVPSDQRWRYKPGEIIVSAGVGPLGERYAVRIPTLAVFADPEFVKHHCFRDGGDVALDGQSFRRIDFRAAETIRDPDIDGTMYLDPQTFVIRRSTVSLSRKSRYTSSYDSVTVETSFDELVSGVPVITSATGRSLLTADAGDPGSRSPMPDGSRFISDLERQRVREIRFLHEVPGVSDTPGFVRDRRDPKIIRLSGPGGRARLVGVFDADSGEPLPGTVVRDSASGRMAATTATGTVNLGFVPRSSAVILFEHAGYDRLSMPVSLTPADTLPITVILHRSRAPR